MDIKELIESYLWVLKVEKRISINSYKSYGYDFKIFENWLKTEKIPIANEDLIINYYQYLKEEKKNLETSIARKINLIIAFFKYCNEEKGCCFLIPERKNKKLIKTYRTFMESEDLEQIRQYLLNNKDKNSCRLSAIVEILYSTGLRVSELLKIRKIDVYEIKKSRSLQVIGKGGVKRIVFFNDFAIQSIDSYLNKVNQKNDFLFPITRQRVFQLLKNLGNELDIDLDKIFPHSFRHRLLTDLVQKGMNLVNVQKIAGHKQISTTEKYTHVEDYLYEEIYKYHPLVKHVKK